MTQSETALPGPLPWTSSATPSGNARQASLAEAERPKISVLILAFSRRQFVRDAVESVLSQSLSRNQYEVIVLKGFDDGVIDPYLSAHGVKSHRVERGWGFAYSEGVRLARAEVICFLDDDDLFFSHKLACIVEEFSRFPRLGYLHNTFIVDSGNRPIDLGEQLTGVYKLARS